MKETRIMTNEEIYECGRRAITDFSDDISLPVKVGFYLRKNLKEMMALAKEVDEARADILSKYGELTEDGTKFNLRPECIADANKEVRELMHITQIVDVYMLDLDDFDGITLTSGQIDAIAFMLNEE